MEPHEYCSSCVSDWAAGAFKAGCAECGGGGMWRSCPTCGGLCGAVWRRALADSRDSHVAHWLGACSLPADRCGVLAGRAPPTGFSWWLDGSSLPGLDWACLIAVSDRAFAVDPAGNWQAFASRTDAEAFLREDEYDDLETLRCDWAVAGDLMPPAEMIAAILDVLGRGPP